MSACALRALAGWVVFDLLAGSVVAVNIGTARVGDPGSAAVAALEDAEAVPVHVAFVVKVGGCIAVATPD